MSHKQERSRIRVPSRHLRPGSAPADINETSSSTHTTPQAVPVDRTTRRNRVLHGSKARIGFALLFVVVVVLIVTKLTGQDGDASADIDRRLNQPSYQTVLPTGKTIEQVGGWQRVSPVDKDPVFAYSDSIGAVPITVSQQPMPSNVSGDNPSQVAELAKKLNAPKRLTTINGTAYLGVSANGPQSVVLAKGNTLILIKSKQTINDQDWIAYIDSLGLSY